LKDLYLGNNEFIGQIPVEILTLQKLRFFILHNNKFTGQIPFNIGNMVNLFYLDLSYNELAGTLPPSLVMCKKLRHVYLDHNMLAGPIPSFYGRLGNYWLIDLTLDSNQLVGGVPEDWGDRKKLLSLKVQDNNLSWKIPKELCNLWAPDGEGELVELGADCRICDCHFCKGRCY